MTQGLGEHQAQQRKETDKKIHEFIKKHPSSHVRGIIKQLNLSPNAVTHSIDRLLESKKIILLKDSNVFYTLKNKNTKKIKSLVCYYPELEEKKKMYFDKLKQESDSIIDELKEMQNKQRNSFFPLLNNYAENLAVIINKNHYPTLLKLSNALGIKKINESMIGVYIFRLMEKICLARNDVPWAVKFYFDMLPDKYTHIKFEDSQDQDKFICKNTDIFDEIKHFISCDMKQTPIT